MNRKQKVALCIAIAAIALLTLAPPRLVECDGKGDSGVWRRVQYGIGHTFLWDIDIKQKRLFAGEGFVITIDLSRLVLEYGSVTLVTVGLLALLSDRKRELSSLS